MGTSRTFASIPELPLAVMPHEARHLLTRLEMARQVDGACLGQSLTRPEPPSRSECHQVAAVPVLVLLRLVLVKSNRKEACSMGAQCRNCGIASASDLAFAPAPLSILPPRLLAPAS